MYLRSTHSVSSSNLMSMNMTSTLASGSLDKTFKAGDIRTRRRKVREMNVASIPRHDNNKCPFTDSSEPPCAGFLRRRADAPSEHQFRCGDSFPKTSVKDSQLRSASLLGEGD